MDHKRAPGTQAEIAFWDEGYQFVAGLDEAGRGPWAGPVYAAAVVLPRTRDLPERLAGVRDSKTLSARQRERLVSRIRVVALAVGVGWATAAEVDEVGIVPATHRAMTRALNTLSPDPEALILDAITLPAITLPQRGFPRADAHSLSVAAASIVAKVSRDRWMVETAEVEHPGYGFAQHKGYGTPQHRDALQRLGVCAIHRRTFKPVAARLAEDAWDEVARSTHTQEKEHR